MKLLRILFGCKGETVKLESELESKLKRYLKDLEEVRAEVKELTDSARGLVINLDTKCQRNDRAETLYKIMAEGGIITKSMDKEGKTIRGRFATILMGDMEKRDFSGIGLLYFSREFVELERKAVEIRARIIAMENNVAIKSVELIEPSNMEANTELNHVGTAKNWDDVVKKVAKLYETGCIQYFANVPLSGLRNKGHQVAINLKTIDFDTLAESAEKAYPNPKKIDMYIGELMVIKGMMQKQLVAMPFKNEELM